MFYKKGLVCVQVHHIFALPPVNKNYYKMLYMDKLNKHLILILMRHR